MLGRLKEGSHSDINLLFAHVAVGMREVLVGVVRQVVNVMQSAPPNAHQLALRVCLLQLRFNRLLNPDFLISSLFLIDNCRLQSGINQLSDEVFRLFVRHE